MASTWIRRQSLCDPSHGKIRSYIRFGLSLTFLLALHFDSAMAIYDATIGVRNGCSETIVVNVQSTYNSYSRTIKLAPEEQEYFKICPSFCTASLLTCGYYYYTIDASVLSSVCDGSISTGGSIEVCPIGDGRTDVRRLTCDSCRQAPPPVTPPPKTPPPKTPPPKTPPPKTPPPKTPPPQTPPPKTSPPKTPLPKTPSPITPPPKALSPITLPPQTSTPQATSQLPGSISETENASPQRPLPLTYEEIQFKFSNLDLDTFNATAIKKAISKVTGIGTDWVEIFLVSTSNAANRRLHSFRALLQQQQQQQQQPIAIYVRIYTENPEILRDTLVKGIEDGSLTRALVESDATLEVSDITYISRDGEQSDSSEPLGAIIGGVLGGLAVILLGIIGYIVIKKRRLPSASTTEEPSKVPTSSYPSKTKTGFEKTPPTKPTSLMLSVLSKAGNERSQWKSDMSMEWMDEQAAYRSQRIDSEPLRPFEIAYSEIDVMPRPIGEGSFGRVYAGKYKGEHIAIKVFMDSSTAGSSYPNDVNPVIQKIDREVSVISRLNHPRIVEFKGWCSAPPAIVTELCSLGSLADVLAAAAKTPDVAKELTWSRRMSFAIDAAHGLLYLHEQGVLHRDLKSANLLVADDWSVKITDFNLSKLLEASPGRRSSMAAMNPRWLAPELFAGKHATKECDIFAMGIILWEILTFKLPWGSENPWMIVSFVQSGQRPPIPDRKEVPGAVPHQFCYDKYVAIMEACWAKQPENRPPAQKLLESLEHISASLT